MLAGEIALYPGDPPINSKMRVVSILVTGLYDNATIFRFQTTVYCGHFIVAVIYTIYNLSVYGLLFAGSLVEKLKLLRDRRA